MAFTGFALQQRVSAKTWRTVRTFATLADAQAFAFLLDPDGLLIDVRIRRPDGAILKPAALSSWEQVA